MASRTMGTTDARASSLVLQRGRGHLRRKLRETERASCRSVLPTMAHFKRKRQYSRMASRCTICAGQRRTFGAGNQKFRALEKARKHAEN